MLKLFFNGNHCWLPLVKDVVERDESKPRLWAIDQNNKLKTKIMEEIEMLDCFCQFCCSYLVLLCDTFLSKQHDACVMNT